MYLFIYVLFHRCIKRAYKSKHGKEAIVGHWERVANISEWLDVDKRTHKMDGVSSYYHFRFFKPAGDPNEVWMQARTWPGAPEDEDSEDIWRGLETFETHVVVFPKPDKQPDLYKEWETIPPSQRPSGQTLLEPEKFIRYGENILNGLNKLQKMYPSFTDEHFKDCVHLLDLWKTPLAVPIPFDWPLSEIESLLKNNKQPVLSDDVDVEVQRSNLAIVAGAHYVIAPSEEDKKTHGDIPFYILRVKKTETTDLGEVYCRVQWFEAHDLVTKKG